MLSFLFVGALHTTGHAFTLSQVVDFGLSFRMDSQETHVSSMFQVSHAGATRHVPFSLPLPALLQPRPVCAVHPLQRPQSVANACADSCCCAMQGTPSHMAPEVLLAGRWSKVRPHAHQRIAYHLPLAPPAPAWTAALPLQGGAAAVHSHCTCRHYAMRRMELSTPHLPLLAQAADVYAYGIFMYELFTSGVPYEGGRAACGLLA